MREPLITSHRLRLGPPAQQRLAATRRSLSDVFSGRVLAWVWVLVSVLGGATGKNLHELGGRITDVQRHAGTWPRLARFARSCSPGLAAMARRPRGHALHSRSRNVSAGILAA